MSTTAFAIASTTAVLATTIAVSSYLASRTFETLEEKVEAAVSELIATNQFKGTFIYRAHTRNTYYESLTPRQSDITGMSFFDGIPLLFASLNITEGVFITTVEMVNNVGFKTTARGSIAKGIVGNHYDLYCTDGSYPSWQASMSNARKGQPHSNTIRLMEVVYFVGKDFCGPIS